MRSPSRLQVCKDDFDLLAVIGKGSFGKVMQVRKKDSGEIYAMKILRKDQIIERNQARTGGRRVDIEERLKGRAVDRKSEFFLWGGGGEFES